MDTQKQAYRAELRNEERIPVESGCTVIIQCDSHEIIGTIENKSGGGLGVLVAEASRPYLEKCNVLAMTYSTPFGLVSQRAQVCWIKPKQGGGLLSGVSFLENDTEFQTHYQKLWKQFNDANSLETAARFWLSLQCAMLSGVTRGIVVLGKPDSGSFVPISFWPEGQRGSLGLTEAAELCFT
jgi:hypothetical protein